MLTLPHLNQKPWHPSPSKFSLPKLRTLIIALGLVLRANHPVGSLRFLQPVGLPCVYLLTSKEGGKRRPNSKPEFLKRITIPCKRLQMNGKPPPYRRERMLTPLMETEILWRPGGSGGSTTSRLWGTCTWARARVSWTWTSTSKSE